MPVFGGLKSVTLDFFLSESEIVTKMPGEYFFHENDKGDSLYIIQHGKIQVVKNWEGENYILCTLQNGDCFGEMELIDIVARSASIIALEETETIRLRLKTIYTLLQKDMEDFTMIMMNMGREVSRRLRVADELLLKEKVASGKLKKL